MPTAYVDGILVRVKRTSGRNFSYRASVASNELTICAPARVSEKTLTEFIFDTVKKKREEGVFNVYRDGGYLYLFGEKYAVRVYPTEESRYRVTLCGEDVFIAVPEKATYPVDVAVKRFYCEQLKKRLVSRVPVMESYVGLKCASWSISGYHAAWGKCNFKDKTITFSVDLATQNIQFIDTVIIHELGHLSYPDHGAAFRKYMDRFAPDHRRVLKGALK